MTEKITYCGKKFGKGSTPSPLAGEVLVTLVYGKKQGTEAKQISHTFTDWNGFVPVPCKVARFVKASEVLRSKQVVSIVTVHSTR